MQQEIHFLRQAWLLASEAYCAAYDEGQAESCPQEYSKKTQENGGVDKVTCRRQSHVGYLACSFSNSSKGLP